MRVIFMGTPDFSVGTLEAIIEAGHEVHWLSHSPTSQRAAARQCSIHRSRSVRFRTVLRYSSRLK